MNDNRQTYQPTDRDAAKASQNRTYAESRRQRAEAAAETASNPKSRRRAGRARSAATMDEYKGDLEYFRGLGQARLDRSTGLTYNAERASRPYNLGYYRGWNQPA